MAKFVLFGETLDFHDDLKTYYNFYRDFCAERDNVLTLTRASLAKEVPPIEVNDSVDSQIRSFVNQLINSISNYGVFDKTVEDFLFENKGYLKILQAVVSYTDFCNDTREKIKSITDCRAQSAYESAISSIHGLDFGIISSSVLDHMVYATLSESAKNKQRAEAINQYLQASTFINAAAKDTLRSETSSYYKDTYTPNLIEGINDTFAGLLASYLVILQSCNEFDANCLKTLDCDRSNALMRNLSQRTNKKGVILAALKLYPFNPEIYRNCYIHILRGENMSLWDTFGELIEYFGLHSLLETLLTPQKDILFQAAEALRKKDYTQAHALYSDYHELYPDDPSGAQGLVLCESQMFSCKTSAISSLVAPLCGFSDKNSIRLREMCKEYCDTFLEKDRAFQREQSLKSEVSKLKSENKTPAAVFIVLASICALTTVLFFLFSSGPFGLLISGALTAMFIYLFVSTRNAMRQIQICEADLLHTAHEKKAIDEKRTALAKEARGLIPPGQSPKSLER